MSNVADKRGLLWPRVRARWKGARAVSRWLPFAPLVLATATLAAFAISGILTKVGHPAVPLDDAFIHFQYAKRLATGHFFSYSEGDGYSSGATSLVWPTALAIVWGLGARGLEIIWGAWLFGFVAEGALAYETYRLAAGLTGRSAALGAGAMVLCFGGYLWCAASGMETTLLAWVLARTARRAAEWSESRPDERSARFRRELLVLAAVAPFIRPEGMIASAVAAATLAIFPTVLAPSGPAPSGSGASGAASSRSAARSRAWGILALAGAFGPALLNWMLTGHSASSTAIVKWLPLNPYYGRSSSLIATVRDNVGTFVRVLLNGEVWSAVFVPTGSRPFALAALVAIPLAASRARRPFRGALVLLMALSMLVPCTYLSFLWNRLRYLWPFTFGWFVGLSCAASLIRDAVLRLGFRAKGVETLVAGAFAGALASHLPWTLDDLATSAAAIDKQQVKLGKWAAGALPEDARIGVNDTGAIGYLSEHRTFDVVGLTTPSEARYWVSGSGSRFEHYERLAEKNTSLLPTHFIVYPHWMACDVVLGDEMERATVTDQSILGGVTMIAYEANWDLLQTGARPVLGHPIDNPIDELDVADLESEKDHDYELGPNAETDCLPITLEDNDQIVAADGARLARTFDRFTLHGGSTGQARTLVARLTSASGAKIELLVAGRSVVMLDLAPSNWEERTISIPDDVGGPISVELVSRDARTFGSAHYWLYGR